MKKTAVPHPRWQKVFAITVLLGLFSVNLFAAGGAQVARTALRQGRMPLLAGDQTHEYTGPLHTNETYGPNVTRAVHVGRVAAFKDVDPHAPYVSRFERAEEEELEILPKVLNGKSEFRNDPVLQTDPGLAPMPAPLANFDGLAFGETGPYLPPDSNGDIGYDPITGKRYYFTWVNVAYKAWDVTNPTSPTVVIPTTNGNALWAAGLPDSQCAADNDGDPIVLFDEQAHRWLITQFALNGGAGPSHQCIAISQSANPTGGWYLYDFLYSETELNDYPHFGVWPDATYNAYFMTANEFEGDSWSGAGVVAFDRAKMLLGDPSATMIAFDLYTVNDLFGGMLPADLDGAPPAAGTPGLFFEVDETAWGLGQVDEMRIWEFRPNFVNPASSTFGLNGEPNTILEVADFNLPPCILAASRECVPQPGTTAKLDSLGDRLMYRAAFRNFGTHQSIVFNHTVHADGFDRLGIRWYEMRRNPTNGAWTLHQQSTYAPADGRYRWLGSMAMDVQGNIGLGYSLASSNVYPATAYAGRLVSDTLNTLAQTEVIAVISPGSQTSSSGRWGDYSVTGVDPQDQCTFWTIQEYHGVTSGTSWRTRITSFKFPGCTLGAVGTLTGTVTNSTNGTPVSNVAIQVWRTPTQTVGAGTTNAQGIYNIQLPTGTYTLTAARYGYFPYTTSGINILTGTTTTRSFVLTPTTMHVVSGTVTDNASGQALWANISVVGAPLNPPVTAYQTNPTTGFYSMTLASGQAYTLTASALMHVTQTVALGTVNGNLTRNFALTTTTPTGGLIGYVRNYYTNQPVFGAQVSIPGFGNATTNAQGYFQLLGVTPGTYTATAAANLYSPASITNIPIYTGTAAYRVFMLPTSILTYTPSLLQKTLTLNTQVTDTGRLVLTNTGLGNLTFNLEEHLRAPLANRYLVVNQNSPIAESQMLSTLTALGYAYDSVDYLTFESATLASLLQYQGVIYLDTTASASTEQLMAYLDAGGRLLILDNDLGYFYGGSDFYDLYLDATYGDDDPGAGNRDLTGEDIMAGINVDSSDPYPDFYTQGSSSVVIFRYGDSSVGGTRITRNGYKAIYIATDFDSMDSLAQKPLTQAALNWLTLNNFAWLTESPTTGAVAGGASNAQAINIGWNATAAGGITQPGTYTATLKVQNNDPARQNAQVAAVLTVLPSATQGNVVGTVTSSGVCDTNPYPIAGATVWFVKGANTFSTTTNANGNYSYWLEAPLSPYSLTVTAAQHPTTTRTLTVTAGVTNTQNFTLRLQQPCLGVAPAGLSATVQLSATASQTFTVNNTGATAANFQVFEDQLTATGGGPNAFGYHWSPATYNWIDATDGTALGLADDEVVTLFASFPFPYYSGVSDRFRVGNNGAVLFNTAGPIGFANLSLTAAEAPNNFIAPFWDDLDASGGEVYVKEIGTAPNRKLVIAWVDRPHYSEIGAATFEVVLFENGNILYQYQDVDFGSDAFDNGASATVGIRGVGAANSLQRSFNTAALADGLALCFRRPGNPGCDSSADVLWLRETPTTTVGLTNTQLVGVTFDGAQVPTPGVYTASVIFAHNTPQSFIARPVTLTVLAPPSWGSVQGVVNSLGACNTAGGPVSSASLSGTGPVNFTTNASSNGSYWRALPAGVYTLTVSAADYLPQTTVVTVTTQQTLTRNFTLQLNAPCAQLALTPLSSVQFTNQQTSKPLTISNNGVAPLLWWIMERTSAVTVPSGNPLRVRPMHIQAPAAPAPDAPIESIRDGGFELGTPNGAWEEFSLNFGTPLCDVGCTPTGGTQAPHSGEWWAWFGGIDDFETSYVSQQIVITGNAQLSFWLQIESGSGTGNDYFNVLVDDTPVFTVTDNTPGYTTYTPVNIDLSAFGDGQVHTLKLYSQVYGNGVTSFMVDDIGPCNQDVPWLTAAPASGSTAVNTTSTLNLIFDSTGLSVGTYATRLCVNTNDPTHTWNYIPVTMTVAYPIYGPFISK